MVGVCKGVAAKVYVAALVKDNYRLVRPVARVLACIVDKADVLHPAQVCLVATAVPDTVMEIFYIVTFN